MKKVLFFLITVFLVFGQTFAQPKLMNYQGVARDKLGKVISNKNISLRISIISGDQNGPVVYSETHMVKTSKFGVFSIHIGSGSSDIGVFPDIMWASANHFVKVGMDIEGGNEYMEMGVTQLLSVPYAFHSQTTDMVLNSEARNLKGGTGVASQNWSLFGNYKSDPSKDKLGTTDEQDLVFVTNNIERLRISSFGQLLTPEGVGLEIGNNFSVTDDQVDIGKDLFVGRNVFLNVDNEISPRGATLNFGDFTVENGSNTLLTGELNVLGTASFESGIAFGDNAQVDGNLNVGGILSVNTDKFLVSGASGNTNISGDLGVEGNGSFNNLSVKGRGETGGNYVAVFENTFPGSCDGIKIVLGKPTANNGLQDINLDVGLTVDQISKMKNLISCDYDANYKMSLLGEIVVEGLVADIQTIGGLTVGVGNLVVDFINSELGLPLQIVPKITVFPGYDLDLGCVNLYIGQYCGLPGISIPSRQIGPYSIPDIPEIDLSSIGISGIDLYDLDFWGVPDLCLNDVVTKPLDNLNHFVSFFDSQGQLVGAIKAESVEDWVTRVLNPRYLMSLRSAITKSVDKNHGMYHFKSIITEALTEYSNLGVEYSSGNGDYAEWLERIDPEENISAGDIVAVIGGKITKDLENAEQVMSVSAKPIVLGNLPDEERVSLGNSIAFMGQIPVKVMGPVESGDYIVGRGEILGYGVAINPGDMSIEDFRMTVGRSWENDQSKGPKMVNTVIGIHNGDYLKILKRYEQKFIESESRLEDVEMKIEALSSLLENNELFDQEN